MFVRWLSILGHRCRSLFFGRQADRELDEEIAYHLQREIDERVAAGVPPHEAAREARRTLGRMTQSIEECRDMRRVNTIENLAKDIRFAARQLRRHPGFACTAIVMLALGLAANVTIFAFVDAILIRPLPYADQSRLGVVFASYAKKGGRGPFSYLDYLDVRDRNGVLQSIDAYDLRTTVTLTTREGAERVVAPRVTAGFFRTLGVTPVRGRDFTPGEEGLTAPPAVLLSYGAWQTRFGGREDVLGQMLTIQGEAHPIIGVLPRDFHFTRIDPAEFWLTVRGKTFATSCWERRDCRSMVMLARLPAGLTSDGAAAALDPVMHYLRQQNPVSNGEVSANVVPLRDLIVGDVRPVVLVAMNGAAMLLLIAGINVCSLLLARSDGRAREIAVRDALGASSSRLMMQFAAEAALLVVAGTTIGLTLSAWGMRSLLGLMSADMVAKLPFLQGLGLNPRLLAFAAVLSILATGLFALTPVLRLPSSDRSRGLKEGSRGSAGTTWRRFGSTLVVAELAAAAVLLVGAGLLGKSFYRLLDVDLGLNPDNLLILNVGLRPGDTSVPPGQSFPRMVADRLASVPGVAAVGYADQLPLAGGDGAPASTFTIVGRPEAEQRRESHPVRRVSPGYFSALQARLIRGRYFSEDEIVSQSPVVIINESAAQRYYPNEDPIGKQLAFGRPPTGSAPQEIVGIIADMKDTSLEVAPRSAAYRPFESLTFGVFAVRTSQAGLALLPSLVSAVREVNAGAVISGEMTMVERMNRLPATHLHRSSAWVVGAFAAVAFLLSVIGLYGVVAYSVGQRRREIGVRIALGAERRAVSRMVLTEAARLVALGGALGIACAFASARLMRGLLFGVTASDPATLAGVVMTLSAAALVASYIPARRAASVDPIEALRGE